MISSFLIFTRVFLWTKQIYKYCCSSISIKFAKFHHFWSPTEKLLEKSTSGPRGVVEW